MQDMRLIVAIPSYNRPDLLGTILGQLQLQQTDRDFQVLVLNDGGHKDSESVIMQAAEGGLDIMWEQTERPSGLPSARNKILDHIDGCAAKQPTTVVFLDDDCQVDEHFIEHLYEASLKYDGFTFAIETVGRSGIINTKYNPLLSTLLSPFFGKAWLNVGFLRAGYFQKKEKPLAVDHLPGGCLAYRFDKFSTLRFDTFLNEGNAITEDTDFSMALTRAGAQLWYCGYYGIKHVPGNAGGVRVASPKEKYTYYWRNKTYLCRKWYGGKWIVPARAFMFLESFFLSILHRSWLMGAWFASRKMKVAKAGKRLSIVAPISGINPHSTLGGEVYDAQLLAALCVHADVHVIVPHGSTVADAGSGWSVSTIKKSRFSLLYYVAQLRAVLARYKNRPFDILWVHSPYSMTPFMLFAKMFLPDVKVHAQYLHREKSLSKTLLSWLGIRFWDSMSSCSRASADDIASYFGTDRHDFLVAYPGVRAYEGKLSSVDEYAGAFVLLHVGSLIARKNVSFLLDVVAACREDVMLVVLGGGPQDKELKEKAVRLGIQERVIFEGRCSEERKHAWLNRADMYVLASFQEGFGMGVIDAAQYSTPSLVSDLYSLPEVVQDEQTGLVRPLEVSAWARAVGHLQNDRERLGQLGSAAKQWAGDTFTAHTTAKRVFDHLKALV